MMNEATFSRQDLVPRLKQWGAACRLESSTESGIPDILYSINGNHGLIESKVVHTGKIYFTKFQPAWLLRHWTYAPNNMWVFITDGKSVFAYTALEALVAPRITLRGWLVANFSEFPTPLVTVTRRGNWDEIKQLLWHK